MNLQAVSKEALIRNITGRSHHIEVLTFSLIILLSFQQLPHVSPSKNPLSAALPASRAQLDLTLPPVVRAKIMMFAPGFKFPTPETQPRFRKAELREVQKAAKEGSERTSGCVPVLLQVMGGYVYRNQPCLALALNPRAECEGTTLLSCQVRGIGSCSFLCRRPCAHHLSLHDLPSHAKQCHTIRVCGKAHQKAVWRAHKVLCFKVQF